MNVWWTAVQTMAIAGAAALAGVVIGRLELPVRSDRRQAPVGPTHRAAVGQAIRTAAEGG